MASTREILSVLRILLGTSARKVLSVQDTEDSNDSTCRVPMGLVRDECALMCGVGGAGHRLCGGTVDDESAYCVAIAADDVVETGQH